MRTASETAIGSKNTYECVERTLKPRARLGYTNTEPPSDRGCGGGDPVSDLGEPVAKLGFHHAPRSRAVNNGL